MEQFADLILLIIIFAFIAMKLYSLLGQKREFSQEQFVPEAIQKRHAIDQNEINYANLSVEDKFKVFDPSFTKATFINNSQKALELIYELYARGDTGGLAGLVNMKLLRNLAFDISNIESHKYQAEIKITKFNSAEIISESLSGTTGRIKLKYDLNMVVKLADENGKFLTNYSGKTTNQIITAEFTRDLKNTDPTWKLSELDYLPYSSIKKNER